MPAHAAVPLGPYALDLDVLEACSLEPLHVLGLGGEQHPGVSKQARQPEGGVHRPN